MDLCQAWITTVPTNNDLEPLPDPRIPADYLQKPRRQHPASKQSQILPPLPYPRSKRKHTTLLEISPPNDRWPLKHQQMPNTAKPTMSQPPRSPLKKSSRTTAKKTMDTNESEEDKIDHNTTPRPARTRTRTALALAAAEVPIPILNQTAIPALIPSAPKGGSDLVRRDNDRSVSPVTESTDSATRSSSPTKRMVDLRVAEKALAQKGAKSPADVPEDVRKLYKAIRSLAFIPRNIIPLGIEVRALH